jgi:hypothetical protein
MSIIGQVRHCPGAIFSILVLSVTLLEGGQSDRQPKYGGDWSRLLHVIAFAERSSLGGDDVTLDVLERDSADFPVKFSQMLYRGLNHSSDELFELGLPPRIELDDIYTFELTDEILSNPKPVRRWNQFSELEYFLGIEHWTEDSYDLTLRGKVRKNGFKGVTAHVHRDRTTVLRISDVDRLYFVFTPLDAVDFANGIARVGDEGLKPPVPVKQTIPPVPSELVNRKVTGRGASVVVFVGIVEKSGVFNSGEHLLVECPHAAFAGEPLSRIFQEWRLLPAEKEGQPVDSVVSVELQFNVR